MDYPVAVALAESVAVLPEGDGWWYEPKFDGDRGVVWRRDAVRIQTRAGRDATEQWLDIAAPAMALPRDTVLDGELVIWRAGRVDFGAVRSRSSARGRRLAGLMQQWPASFAAFDCLMLGGQDLRGRPYTERRAALLDVLEPLGPPLQPVPATDDVNVARVWYETLTAQGIEGIVAKRADSPYRANRSWKKIRHSESVDVAVVGYVGPPGRPRRLALRLPDGRCVLSRPVSAGVSAEAAEHIAGSGPGAASARTDDGEPYAAIGPGLVAEVESGTTRHSTVTVMRLR
ncbi:ATP-dependent DNA ligase (plasmid) [Streptomyces sp. SDT5-1]|uniref:ATP-dependent DNA ligase n=1 Tax=Streptomyces sp. SDT5-1 TaxID=3406418 RepID=UPI003FD34175